MASLTGSTIAASYEQLLSLPDGGLNGNTLVAITDGDSSTAIGMKVATSKIEVIPASDDANAFEVSNAAGTAILTVNSSTPSVTIAGDTFVSNGSGVVIGHGSQETISIGDGATDLVPELQMLGTGQVDASLMLAAFSTTATAAGAPLIALVKGGNGTIGSHTVVTDGEELGNIIAYGDDGTDLEAPAAQIQFEVDGTPGTGDMPGRIILATTADGAETATEHIRLDSAGKTTLTQTVTTAASTPIALLVDANTSGVAAQNSVGMHVDFDRTVAGSGTAAHNDIGINLDVNSASLGTSSLVGMDIDVVGATSGTSTATGLNIAVGSADTNYALITSGGNVGIGVADPDETLEVSGDAKVSGNLYFYDTGGESISSNGSVLSIAGGAEIDLTATDIDINGAANISGALVIGGDVSMTQAGQAILHVNSTGDAAQLKLSALSGDGNYEWSIYSNNAADQFLIVDGSATRLVIDSDGFVGIGTTAPRSAQGYSGSILEIGSADDVALVLTSDDGEAGENMWEIGNNTSGVLQFVHSVAGDGSTGTKMVVDASGKVGIGVSAPATTLDIHSAGSEVAAAFGMADDGPAWIASRTGEALNNYSAYAFMVGTTATDSVASANTTAYIASTVKNDGGALQGDLHFYTNAGDSLSTAKMMITSAGNVGIGVTDPASAKLQILGPSGGNTAMLINAESHLVDADKILFLNFNNNSATPDDDGHFIYAQDGAEQKFSVYSDGDVFSRSGDDVAALSDERLKTNIADYKDGLAFINSLKPRKFNWKEGINRPSDTQYGFSAQEIEEVSDKSMRLYKKRTLGEDASEHKYIDDGVLYTSQLKGKDAQYVSAIQELHTIIQELSAKVTALENA